MRSTVTRHAFAPILALILALTALASFGVASPSLVRAITIECPAPASPAAAAATTTAPAVAASPVAFPENAGELTVFAAASLTDAFNQIKADLEAANPGLTITFNFAGSQALVTQMEEGATADVFASANATQMKNATEKGVISGTSSVFVQNSLALIVPADNPAGITGLADLAKDGVKIDLAAQDVPAGQYARQSFCKAAQDTATYGEDFLTKVGDNVVSEEDNVRAVVTKVSTGEADAGIVYITDVNGDLGEGTTSIEIPTAVNVVAKYPIAAVNGGNAELAQAFIDYVLGPDGQATLANFGFAGKP